MEKDKAIKIGLILIIMSGLFYWGFSFLQGKNVFTKENLYYAEYDRIDGLQKNTSILLRGHKIGVVSDMYFSNTEYKKITLVFSINKDILIPENTKARIFSSDIMGTKSIDLILPNSTPGVTARILKNGDKLIPDIEGSITDQVRLEMAPIKKQAEKLLENTAAAIDQLKYVLNESTGDYIQTSFAKLQGAIDAIHNSCILIDTILTRSNNNIEGVLVNVEHITKTISDKSGEINNIITNFSHLSDTLAKSNVAETILNTNKAITDFNVILQKVNKGEGTLGTLIMDDTLYKNLEKSSKSLDDLLLDIKNHPKKYVSFPILEFSKKQE